MIQKIKKLLPKTVRFTLGAARRNFRDRVYYHKRRTPKNLKINAVEGNSFCKVVLIVIDSLRKDSLSYYGYERKTTPFIDSLIQDTRSIAFHNFHSASSWTYPSVTSMLSGLYPHKHGGVYPKEYRNMHTDRPNHWDDGITFLPDIFQELGYETVFLSPIGSAHLASQGLFKRSYFNMKFQNTDSIFKRLKQIISSEHKKQFVHCQVGGLHYPVFVPENFKNLFEEIPNDIDNLDTYDYLDDDYTGNKNFERYAYYRKLYYDVSLRYIDNHLESFFNLMAEDVAFGYEKKAIIAPPYKLLVSTGDNVSWLFDLDKDSAEKQPIEHNEIESQLKALLPEGYLDTESELQYDKKIEDNLRALGYLE